MILLFRSIISILLVLHQTVKFTLQQFYLLIGALNCINSTLQQLNLPILIFNDFVPHVTRLASATGFYGFYNSLKKKYINGEAIYSQVHSNPSLEFDSYHLHPSRWMLVFGLKHSMREGMFRSIYQSNFVTVGNWSLTPDNFC